jgi:hypothetical protein
MWNTVLELHSMCGQQYTGVIWHTSECVVYNRMIYEPVNYRGHPRLALDSCSCREIDAYSYTNNNKIDVMRSNLELKLNFLKIGLKSAEQ